MTGAFNVVELMTGIYRLGIRHDNLCATLPLCAVWCIDDVFNVLVYIDYTLCIVI